jgi:hypothetical protein
MAKSGYPIMHQTGNSQYSRNANHQYKTAASGLADSTSKINKRLQNNSLPKINMG